MKDSIWRAEMCADRIEQLPLYLFAEIVRMREKKREEGVDVIDFSVGDPDIPTPSHVIDELYKAAKDPSTHSYPTYIGLEDFRVAVADWYKQRFGVNLSPQDEVITLIGSKEGVAHTPLAFLNPGDPALVPSPGYPVYKMGTKLADGRPIPMPLKEENDFLPDLEGVDPEAARDAKLMFLNYPNNPTATTAPRNFFRRVVEFAEDHEIIVCHDNPYSEITFDGYKAPSFLEVDGAFEVGIEYNSLSKTYNMAGWRIGYAVGNSEVLRGIGEVKTNIDSGAFEAIQRAGIAALRGPQDVIMKSVEIYRERRNLLVEGLRELGLRVERPKATFFIWTPIPEGYDSMGFTRLLLDECGVVPTPGIGFGEHGEGYVRFSFTVALERIRLAVERMMELDL